MKSLKQLKTERDLACEKYDAILDTKRARKPIDFDALDSARDEFYDLSEEVQNRKMMYATIAGIVAAIVLTYVAVMFFDLYVDRALKTLEITKIVQPGFVNEDATIYAETQDNQKVKVKIDNDLVYEPLDDLRDAGVKLSKAELKLGHKLVVYDDAGNVVLTAKYNDFIDKDVTVNDDVLR